jgi:hypothetical protein
MTNGSIHTTSGRSHMTSGRIHMTSGRSHMNNHNRTTRSRKIDSRKMCSKGCNSNCSSSIDCGKCRHPKSQALEKMMRQPRKEVTFA